MRISTRVQGQTFAFEPKTTGEGGKLTLLRYGEGEPVTQELRCRQTEAGVEVLLRQGSPVVVVPLDGAALQQLGCGESVTVTVRGLGVELKVDQPREELGAAVAPRQDTSHRGQLGGAGAGAAAAAAPATGKAPAPAGGEPRPGGGVYPPMPGNVVKIVVAVGARVAAGDVLLILEAMKMQNEVRAPHAGVVTRLSVQVGQRVDKSTLLAVVEG
ncbi:MAG: biotin/lipoyl-binding protein [Deltaproteobacteria bacterium]|nr:biotin/lipoyl-binding protein [Deltaproteobacteria bacterium]